jgi:hypothetical protein
MAKTIGDGDKTDFDETRRLLYMALLAPRTKRYNLAGTLVNALTHHHAVDGLSADEVAGHVVDYLENGGSVDIGGSVRVPGGATESEAFLREQIDRISAELGD